MLFRYSRLCGTASDAVDAVKLEIPQGFKLLKYKCQNTLKILLNLPSQEFETLSLGSSNFQR